MSRIDTFFTALARAQARRPLVFVLLAFVCGAAAIPLILQLGIKGNFTALLPESKPSVRDFDMFSERFGISSTLSIAVHGDDIEEVRRLTRDLGESLENTPPEAVRFVDWNLSGFNTFVERNKYLYADYDDIKKVRDAIHERIDYEKTKANPLFIDLGDAPEDPIEVINKLRSRENEYTSILGKFPGGYLQHPELNLTILFVRTDVKGGEVPRAEALVDEVKTRVQRLRPDLEARGLRVDLGGDMMDVLVEVQALQREIAIATTATIFLVLLCVYAFFLSKRAIPLLGLSLIPPVLITFGVAELTVDFLNTSTAFLGSIVIGNGINPNIIWLARYFEIRRSGEEVEDALVECHRSTWVATLTAALAAGLAYTSLVITDFRGFRDFGTIGGAGMAFCWLAAYLLLPAFTVLWERMSPVKARADASHRNIYGQAFSWLALRSPRATVVGALALTALSAVVAVQWVRDDPMEYDYRRLQSKRDPDSRIRWVNERQGEIVTETVTGSAIAVLTNTREEAEAVHKALVERREQHGDVYKEVISMNVLVPEQQAEKIAMLEDIRTRVTELKPHLSEKDWAEVEANLPPPNLTPVRVEDVPLEAARLFTEVDGSQGRVVYVETTPGQNTWDGLYLIKWSNAVRSVELPNGERPAVAGTAPVFADLLDSVLADGPRAVVGALLVTCVLVFVAFKAWRDRLLTLGALLVGILWMAATMALSGMKLNFLNFVAFPITFGNGVDYGVNVMKRVVQEEEQLKDSTVAVRKTIEATGGAVILCSLTTIIGYISLFVSSNQALNSFGMAMAISEVTCLGTAVVALPAIIAWREQRRGRAVAAPSSQSESAAS